MVLRTKTTVTDSEAEFMAKAIEKQLTLKLVTVILKQRSEYLSDVTLHVVHPSRADRLIRQLEANGYDDGPDNSAPFQLREGDVLEVGFRGNVKAYDGSQQLEVVYNSPLAVSVTCDVVEVDKFLQRSYTTYKGFVQLVRKVKVTRQKSVKNEDGEVHQETVVEYTREVLCDMLISVPKVGRVGRQRGHLKNSCRSLN
ncbi:hypothetical protein NP493_62g00010 [Ridgeia piscesae]|uniref:Uncharacterized protein n=1 Tax=Ridgeia piscesae TaxID=27915 RepID=A0AAD9PA87_RIDPI|nr:hypothetical protein NP493_62g00010 [Ridgeia piscesae]